MGRDTKAPPELWERQPGEPIRAWYYFQMYRDMQKRSIANLATFTGKRSPRALEKYSSRYKWRARAEAWDQKLDNMLLGRQEGDIVKMKNRHISFAIGMQTAANKELAALVRKVTDAADKAEAAAKEKDLPADKAFHEPVLTVGELCRLAAAGIDLERLTRGQHTGHVLKEAEVNLSALSVPELKAFKALKDKMGQG